MKKKLYIVLGVCAVLAVFFATNPFIIHQKPVQSAVRSQTAPSVSVTIDSGSSIATTSGVAAQNAYQALTEAAKKKDLKLTTKQYDFGVFVEAIGSIANTKEKSWIYSVNGKSGTVAADKQTVKEGDSVEWRFIPPTTE